MTRDIRMRIASMLASVFLVGVVAKSDLAGQDKPRQKLDRRLLAEAEKLDDEAQKLYLDGRYAEAAEKLEAAIKKAEKAYGGPPGASTANFMQRAANMYMVLGNMERAEQLTRTARDKHWVLLRELAKKDPNKEDAKKGEEGCVEMIVDCDLYLGNLLLERGRFTEADRELSDALELRKQFPAFTSEEEGQRQTALALLYRGVAKHRLGDIVNARQEIEAAIKKLSAATGGKVTHETILAKLEYAHLLHEQLEYGTAYDILLDCKEKCSEVFPKSRYKNGHLYTVKCLSLLGLTCAVLGKTSDAHTYLVEARNKQKALSANPWDNTLADISNKLGVLALLQGDMEKAEEYFAESLKIRRKLHGKTAHPDLADATHNMSGILIFRGRFKEAASDADEAIRLWEQLYSPKTHKDGHPTLAKAHLVRSLAAAGLRDREVAKTHAAVALVMYKRQAELFATQASEAETLNYIAELAVFKNCYLSAFSLDEQPDYDLLWSAKSLAFRVLNERQRILSKAAKGDDSVRKWTAKWLDVRRRLAGLTLSTASSLDPQRTKQMAALTQEKEELERQMKSTAARDLLPSASPALKDLLTILPEKAAFIDIILYNRLSLGAEKDTIVPSYLVFVVRKGKKPVAVDLGLAEPINAALEKWIAQILAELREDADEEVHRLVWKPLTPHLPTGDGATIYIASDGELARLAWAALPDKKRGTVVLQDYRLALVPNGTFLAERLASTARRFATKPVEGTFLLVADVAYSKRPAMPFSLASARPLPATMRGKEVGGFKDLEHTATEADWIKPIVGKLAGSPRLVERRQEKASVAQVLSDLPDARIVHIATHGIFAGIKDETKERYFRPEDLAVAPNGIRLGAASRNPFTHVAIALAGANLKPSPDVGASLLSGEMLAGMNLELTRLCVLPDCHSARGEQVGGEGVYGLQRALHQAAVDDVVAGLWRVRDDRSPPIMLLFYHHLASGKPPIDALREAQLFLLRNPDAFQLLAKQHAPTDVAKLVAGRPRGDDHDPDFPPRKSNPRPKVGEAKPGSTRDWAVFILSGIGE